MTSYHKWNIVKSLKTLFPPVTPLLGGPSDLRRIHMAVVREESTVSS